MKVVGVIDDEPDILMAMSTILKRHGYDVITGSNAEDVSYIISCHPQLILIDMNMPGKQGSELCRELKTMDGTRDIRVVMTSGNPQLEMAARECGADSYLQKPFGKKDLLKIITSNSAA